MITLGIALILLGLVGWLLDSQDTGSKFLFKVEPAASLDGVMMNFLLQPSMILVGILLIIIGNSFKRKK